MIQYLKLLLLWLAGRDIPAMYHYGRIIGKDKAEARKHRITGEVQVKYRDKADHPGAIDCWAPVRPEFKLLFWYIE